MARTSAPAGRPAGHVGDGRRRAPPGRRRGASCRASRSIVLTADRPPELRDRGAPQTIDQARIYGRAAKWYAELPLLDGDPATRRTSARSRAGPSRRPRPARRARSSSTSRSGSRCSPTARCSREDGALPGAAPSRRRSRRPRGRTVLDDGARRRTSRRCSAGRPGASSSRARTTTRSCPRRSPALRAATGFPILADPLSGLRTGPHDRSRVVSRGRPARPARAVDRRPSPGPRHPDRRDAHVQADPRAARARRGRSSS